MSVGGSASFSFLSVFFFGSTFGSCDLAMSLIVSAAPERSR